MINSDPRRRGLSGNFFWLALALGVLVCTGCNPGTQAAKQTYSYQQLEWQAREPDVKRMQELATGNNAFAFDLYRQLAGGGQDGFAVSPYSVSSGLALVYGGAVGETKRQIADVLQFSLEEPVLHEAFADQEYRYEYWIGMLGECSLVNSLWPQQGSAVPEAFAKLARDCYNTEINTVDFSDRQAAAAQINAWTSAQTRGFLPGTVEPGMFNADSNLVMVNAIVFTQGWAPNQFFREENTRDAQFYLSPVKEVKVRMMFMVHVFRVALGEDFTVLELPLENETSMLVILPDEIDGLNVMEGQLTAGLLDEIRDNLSPVEVDVYLPRLIIDCEVDLMQSLREMGLSKLFEWSGDLAGVVDGGGNRQRLSDLYHDAYIKVNEHGVEAAATTTGHSLASSRFSTPPDKLVFRADHPFCFLIQDDQTGAVYFMGRVVNPAQHGNQPELDNGE